GADRVRVAVSAYRPERFTQLPPQLAADSARLTGKVLLCIQYKKRWNIETVAQQRTQGCGLAADGFSGRVGCAVRPDDHALGSRSASLNAPGNRDARTASAMR